MSTHNGVEGGEQCGKQEIDFKMEADHDGNPKMILQGCAGFLVADVQQNQQKKCLVNNIRPSTSKPLILASIKSALSQKKLDQIQAL